jgi:hypothetical protein
VDEDEKTQESCWEEILIQSGLLIEELVLHRDDLCCHVMFPVIHGHEGKGESQRGARSLVYNDYPISSLVPNLNGGDRDDRHVGVQTHTRWQWVREALWCKVDDRLVGSRVCINEGRLRSSSRSSQVLSGQARRLLLGRLDSRESQFASMSGLFCRCSCMKTKLFGVGDRRFPES